jgi:hypothetical protein
MGGDAVEPQRGVGLREVYVAADLHRTITGVDDGHLQPLRAGVDRDIAIPVDDFTRRPRCAIRHWLLAHAIGWWTVTSFVPSGNVAGQHLAPTEHQLGHGAAVAGTLEEMVGDQRDGLGVVRP